MKNLEVGKKLYISRKEVAELLGVGVRTVDKWKIPHAKIGKRVLYSLNDVKAFIESKKITS